MSSTPPSAGRRRRLPLAASLFALSGLAACAHGTIDATNIEDTEENRQVLSLVEAYQAAVESLDADAVLALVSPRFFEDNGNTDESDDYGFDGLASGLRASFERTKVMQLKMRVDAIEVDDDEAFAELRYEYRAQVEYPSGVQWDTGSDRTRLRLVRTPEADWRIVAGL